MIDLIIINKKWQKYALLQNYSESRLHYSKRCLFFRSCPRKSFFCPVYNTQIYPVNDAHIYRVRNAFIYPVHDAHICPVYDTHICPVYNTYCCPLLVRSADPCQLAQPIDEPLRSTAYEVKNPTYDNLICDRSLAFGWYKFPKGT